MTTSPGNADSKPILRVKVAHFVDARGEQPVGVRVVEPPPDTRQALRGNIYAIVELSGDAAAREDLSERMLSALQRTYYTATGSQSQVLRQAVASARRKLDEFNQHRPDAPLEGGIICAGLVQNRLMLLHSGPALALITSGSTIERYPADILNFDAADPEAKPAIHRQDLSSGGAFFMGGAGWLGEVPLRTLAANKQAAFKQSLLGTVREAILEADGPLPGRMQATTDNYVTVLVPRGGRVGSLVKVRPVRTAGEHLLAEILEDDHG